MRDLAPHRSVPLGVAGLVFAVLLSVGCFNRESAPRALNPTSTAAPLILPTTTTEVIDPSPPPAGSVPLREAPAVPVVSPTPGRGVDSVIQPGVVVTIVLGERAAIADTGWTIRFDQVLEDSRCPVDAQCIWAGQVTARLLGEHTDGRVAALTLTLGPGDRGSGLLGDLSIDAQGIDPPRYAGTPPPADYAIHLRAIVVAMSPAAISGIRGQITVGPMCPVVRTDQSCPDRPYRARLVVRDAAGLVFARAESTQAGAYMIPLPPGSYEIEPHALPTSPLPHASPQRFEVRASAWTTVDIAFDSGIR
jgi:hypothetical protein